ncbi:flagellin [uncultured Clostridium sp.]|uniref:flagellin N-terminal helical domain-containing protein n=1 Tax=uncultured Clostridium sp. TaxID=59620 RepID=UPI00258EB106|nr:flagellin [uncultured Clostridium sp.]
MIINHNMSAMNAHRQMGINNNMQSKAMEKLSSGQRINRAGDDAAGLAISEKMRGQIRGLDQASRNAQDGISMIQTAEGALGETQNILQRMRELAVQAGNDTNTTDDRKQIQQEINQLTNEVNRISNTTEFNTQKLIDGSAEKGFKLQIGANENQSMTIDIKDMGSEALGITTEDKIKYGQGADAIDDTINITANKDLTIEVDGIAKPIVIASGGGGGSTIKKEELVTKINSALKDAGLDATVKLDNDKKIVVEGKDFAKLKSVKNDTDNISGAIASTESDEFVNPITDGTNDTATGSALDVSNHDNAKAAITKFDNAINTVSTERAKLGAFQNRLEHTIANVDTSAENLQAAESRVRDVDMAKEMLNFSKANILSQASQAMLAQAKQAPQGVLQLLR